MNVYPEWWNKTITVYNKFEDPQTRVISWFRTVLSDCFWKETGSKVTVGETVLETNDTICRIPKNDNFLEKYKWINVTNDKMQEYFTLGSGDIIVLGEVDEDINEYQSGYRSSDFLTKYKKLQGCMVINKVAINVGDGLGNEHYYVKGV
jgi:hypothetical protein